MEQTCHLCCDLRDCQTVGLLQAAQAITAKEAGNIALPDGPDDHNERSDSC